MADNCSICQGAFEIPKFLKCGHTFCKSCLDSYMTSSFRKEFIVCPLCRSQTQYDSEQGAQILMDNFFATVTTKSNNLILVCCDCECVTYARLCDHCNSNFCDTCFASHKVIVESGGKRVKPENEDVDFANNDDDEDSRFTMGLQGFFINDTTPTKFCFELKRKIVVPNSNPNARNIDINVSVVHAFGVDKCVVAPCHSNTLIYYNVKGEEIDRMVLSVSVGYVTMGIRGNLLLLDDRTSYVHAFENGLLKQIFHTYEMHPYAISSLNNGRIVLVGHGKTSMDAGMIQIYEYFGQLIRTIRGGGEGFALGTLSSIDINLVNNDIYTGNKDTGIIYRFHENGTFASSCFILETLANLNIDIPLEDLRLIAPVPICYVKENDVVFASCICPISRSILVLSQNLVLLGFFSSQEPMGIPAGLSIDEKGHLYVGDGRDGVIRVFAMSEFKNNVHKR